MDDILLKLDKGWQLGGIELKPNECKVLLQYIQFYFRKDVKINLVKICHL